MDLLMPKLSATMETARVVEWRCAPGDRVARGKPLLEVETDKATMEIEAPADVELSSIVAPAGEEVAVGGLLAVLIGAGDAPGPAQPPAPTAAPATDPRFEPRAARVRASPLARRLAGEMGIDLAALGPGRGPGGRVRRDDVLAAARLTGGAGPRREAPAVALPPPLAPSAKAEAAPPARPALLARDGDVHLLSPMRAAVADSVRLSRSTIPSFSLGRWVDTSALKQARALLGASAAGRPTPTVTDFLLQALADCLAQAPRLRDRYVESEGRPGREEAAGVDIGLVVALPEGLSIPVLRGLEGRSLGSISEEREAAVQRARAGRLAPQDRGSPPFVLSNLGRGGADRFEAIIPPGSTSILAVGREHDRVVALHGAITVRPGIELTLSTDHRLIDGRIAAAFLGDLARRIERGPWTAP